MLRFKYIKIAVIAAQDHQKLWPIISCSVRSVRMKYYIKSKSKLLLNRCYSVSLFILPYLSSYSLSFSLCVSCRNAYLKLAVEDDIS